MPTRPKKITLAYQPITKTAESKAVAQSLKNLYRCKHLEISECLGNAFGMKTYISTHIIILMFFLILPQQSKSGILSSVPDWYMEGKINIDDLITHKMPLEDINKGFDLMHAGESIRSVVEF